MTLWVNHLAFVFIVKFHSYGSSASFSSLNPSLITFAIKPIVIFLRDEVKTAEIETHG
jgi:hypothetical protein